MPGRYYRPCSQNKERTNKIIDRDHANYPAKTSRVKVEWLKFEKTMYMKAAEFIDPAMQAQYEDLGYIHIKGLLTRTISGG